jgi:molybdopterin molybdotransferase
LRMQPGKPVVFGELPRPRTGAAQNENGTKCCFIGLPGNPISSAVTFLLFAAPMLSALAGRIDHGPRFAFARLAAEVKAKPGLTRFLPAACTFSGPIPEVKLVAWQGSGDLAAMALSNCYLVVPEASESADRDSLDAGAMVNILLP